ncbi:unnamed protein product [Didymodactylos carnosus]|uniref:PIH1D1/2/3 CS-like domain-containing protein n=1 Tax=Didymodactylos carnosus TaxID=1234261 RepID=A0A814Q3G1_9BILA|nr:unnamed protein product [Didymodactylos carnosus]CAF1240382.1 unnamed protein product [Didymodactylos carnosus]CAF3878026.1 unnamed protein product [Didymodactylos carnosus]CAF4047851.1 unnamed protein product [Didymodactylos carnosus]
MDFLRFQSDKPTNSVNEKAKHIWKMLDELADSDPNAYKNFIEKTLNDGKEWMAPPTPLMTIRSTLLSYPNIRVFYLNVFTWSRLPSSKTESTKIYSLEPIKTTHNNENCIIVNVAIHPDILECENKNELEQKRPQIIKATFDLIASQYDLLLDSNQYEILTECNCIGNKEQYQNEFVKPLKNKNNNSVNMNSNSDAHEQLLENGLSPSLINQLSSFSIKASSPPPPPPPSECKIASQNPKVLIEEMTDTKSDNWLKPVFTEEILNNRLLIRINLPGCDQVSDCDVTVKDHFVTILCEKIRMKLSLNLKKRNVTDSNRLTAKFIRKTQQLVLSVPVEISQDTTNEK